VRSVLYNVIMADEQLASCTNWSDSFDCARRKLASLKTSFRQTYTDGRRLYCHFKSLWKAWDCDELFALTPTDIGCKFVSSLFTTVLTDSRSPYYLERLFAVYALYTMYYRQPHVPKVKISVSLDTFKTLLSFRLECQGSSQDGFSCLARMHDEHAFEQIDSELDGLALGPPPSGAVPAAASTGFMSPRGDHFYNFRTTTPSARAQFDHHPAPPLANTVECESAPSDPLDETQVNPSTWVDVQSDAYAQPQTDFQAPVMLCPNPQDTLYYLKGFRSGAGVPADGLALSTIVPRTPIHRPDGDAGHVPTDADALAQAQAQAQGEACGLDVLDPLYHPAWAQSPRYIPPCEACALPPVEAPLAEEEVRPRKRRDVMEQSCPSWIEDASIDKDLQTELERKSRTKKTRRRRKNVENASQSS